MKLSLLRSSMGVTFICLLLWSKPVTSQAGRTDDTAGVDMRNIVRLASTENIRKDLRYIYGVRDIGSLAGQRQLAIVRAMIKKRFAEKGLTVHTQELMAGEKKGYNIWGDYKGVDNDNLTYILCAHFDGAPGSPAADDNGSGIAGMLEVLNVLSKFRFRHNIRFIAFDMEENGCVGSQEYIRHGIGAGDSIAAVINFDMIGFSSDKPGSQIVPEGFNVLFPDATRKVIGNDRKGNFVVNIANDSSKGLSAAFERNAAVYVRTLNCITLVTPGNGELTPTMSSSDHGSFWRSGYKALFIGDGGETRNIFLDTPNDVLKNIDYAFIASTVRATIATLAQWAGLLHAERLHSYH